MVETERWIPCSERLPECCGYPVLLTVENGFNQRRVCKAFTDYMKEGELLFLTNEKEYCEELISSKLSNAWKPIAWTPLPEPYSAEAENPQTNADRIRSMTDEELAKYLPMVSDFICQPTEECIKNTIMTHCGECEKTEECAMSRK